MLDFEADKTYTPVEVAKRVGITKEAVYKWIRAGKIDAIRVGNRWRIPGKEIRKVIFYTGDIDGRDR